MLQKEHAGNRDLIVNVNGELLHRDAAGISPFDSVVQGGDAVWEGLRLYSGRIFRLEKHLDRLFDSARALAFAAMPEREEIVAQLRRTLAANEMRDNVHIRLTVTRGVKYTSGMDPRLNTAGPTLIILAEHKPPVYAKTGLSLTTASTRRIPPDCLDQNIHSCNLLNSILAKLEANAAGADDALMLDRQGFVAETNATHLFFVHGATVVTPHTHSCPEGVTRAAVLELCEANAVLYRVADISPSEVYRADEIFCTGTMGEIASVAQVDGREIGSGTPGPVTKRIATWYDALTAREGTKVVAE